MMTIGEKLKAARLEAGLSQRQLCGNRLTRNMLSQIENGSAKPSMSTLGYLAAQLGKSISFFLEEQAVVSPNQSCMLNARKALSQKDWSGMRDALVEFRQPDDLFLEEWRLLQYLYLLGRAQAALEDGRFPYARDLLERAKEWEGLYITPTMQQQRLLLLAQTGVSVTFSNPDELLLIRAKQASTPQRCIEILAAAENKEAYTWNFLQAEALFQLGHHADAVPYYEKAPQNKEVFLRLEICYRELGNFEKAYFYACKQRI